MNDDDNFYNYSNKKTSGRGPLVKCTFDTGWWHCTLLSFRALIDEMLYSYRYLRLLLSTTYINILTGIYFIIRRTLPFKARRWCKKRHVLWRFYLSVHHTRACTASERLIFLIKRFHLFIVTQFHLSFIRHSDEISTCSFYPALNTSIV